MDISIGPPAVTGRPATAPPETAASPGAAAAESARHRLARLRPAAYWLATALVAAELGVGGYWDIARLPVVRDVVGGLGYPAYFLVLLGSWKVLGAIALLAPGRPVVKEWAYAGAFFVYTGAIVSHLSTGYDLGELGLLAVLTPLTVASWALRPAGRRVR